MSNYTNNKYLVDKVVLAFLCFLTFLGISLWTIYPKIDLHMRSGEILYKEGKYLSHQKQEDANIVELRKIESNILREQVKILNLIAVVNQQYIINDYTNTSLPNRSSSEIHSYNYASKAINKNILDLNELITQYNQKANEIKEKDYFIESGLPEIINQMNYVYLVGNQ